MGKCVEIKQKGNILKNIILPINARSPKVTTVPDM